MAKKTRYAEYKDSFANIAFELSDDGILLLRFHTEGGSLQWNAVSHDEVADAFLEVAGDRDIRLVIHTGSGENYNADWAILAKKAAESSAAAAPAVEPGWAPPLEWHNELGWYGAQMLLNLLEIEVPIIAAVNGPCTMHSEIPLMCDVVLASETASFQDGPHFRRGMVPGDGQHIIWPMLLGPVRARYFLLTGQTIDAKQALEWGVVNEVLPADQLLDRAWELGREIAKRPPMATRFTRRLFTQDLKRACLNELSHGITMGVFASRQFYPVGGGMDGMIRAWDDPDPMGFHGS
jgi:enoyl-CoA hydratase/carnithine racemase